MTTNPQEKNAYHVAFIKIKAILLNDWENISFELSDMIFYKQVRVFRVKKKLTCWATIETIDISSIFCN